MTARHHRDGLLAPRRPRTITTYGVHVLDNTREEYALGDAGPKPDLSVYQRDAAADDPWLSPEKSAIFIECLMRIEAAAAHTPVSELPELEWDLRGFCEDAKLTERQTEVIVLAGEGWSQRAIGEWLHIAQPTVWEHLRSGRSKLAGWLPLGVARRLATA